MKETAAPPPGAIVKSILSCKDTIFFSMTYAWGLSKYLIDSTIESIEKELDPTKFFRINRGGIVALSAIDSAKKIAGRYVVEVHPALGLTMIVARSRVDTFLDWLAR